MTGILRAPPHRGDWSRWVTSRVRIGAQSPYLWSARLAYHRGAPGIHRTTHLLPLVNCGRPLGDVDICAAEAQYGENRGMLADVGCAQRSWVSVTWTRALSSGSSFPSLPTSYETVTPRVQSQAGLNPTAAAPPIPPSTRAWRPPKDLVNIEHKLSLILSRC